MQRLHDLGEHDRIAQLIDQFRPDEIPYSRRIFANRNLRMSGVQLVGFDMDYTLCEYHVAVEALQVRLTIERLINDLGYPEELADCTYDETFAIRGLIIDKRLGNLLKMDSHRFISHAAHGKETLTKDARRQLYRYERVRMSLKRFALIDTLFGIPEAWLYATLVELMQEKRGRLQHRHYKQFYIDVRETIDSIHADQSLKTIICADLDKYIRRDPELATMLHRLRESGKRTFLMTNSYGPYTQAVMSYLLDGVMAEYPTWRDYFDIMVVGSRKPSFFAESAPFRALGDDLEPIDERVTLFEPDVIYQGGNLAEFERMAGASGDSVLYVGDHLYGDILRSKKASAWRTAMIVPELERELTLMDEHQTDFERRRMLETHRTQVDRELGQHQKLLKTLKEFTRDQEGVFSPEEQKAFKHAVKVARGNVRKLEKALHKCLSEIWHLNDRLAKVFNANWGMVFKARNEHSIFGAQIEDYACIYTSRASNLKFYSPFQYFRTPRDHLPHERVDVDVIDVT